MWEISGGDTKYPYAMKLVPPKDLGRNVHVNMNHWKYYSQRHHSLKGPPLFKDTNVFVYNQFYYSTNIQKHALIFLEIYDK